jgi:hypothetical protein
MRCQKVTAASTEVVGKPENRSGQNHRWEEAPAKTRSAKAVKKTRRNEGQQQSPRGPSPKVSGLQSGDLEGLSNVESADSESVDELLEEGNAFEAGVVLGVEDSREREGKEVRTREVLEDDVPGEYLDEQ